MLRLSPRVLETPLSQVMSPKLEMVDLHLKQVGEAYLLHIQPCNIGLSILVRYIGMLFAWHLEPCRCVLLYLICVKSRAFSHEKHQTRVHDKVDNFVTFMFPLTRQTHQRPLLTWHCSDLMKLQCTDKWFMSQVFILSSYPL